MRKIKRSFKENKYGFSLTFPSENGICFRDLVGLNDQIKEVKNVVDYIKNKKDYDAIGAVPYTRIFLAGAIGCGKASLVYAVAKEADTPIVVINASNFTYKKTALLKLNALFKVLHSLERAILLIKDFEYIANSSIEMQADFGQKFMNYLNNANKIVVFATVSSASVQISQLFCSDGGFEKVISFIYPELKYRELLYQKFINGYQIAPDVDINRLARDSYGMTGGIIKRIVREALLLAMRENRSEIRQSDFNEIISIFILGEKRKTVTDKEKRATAYHEAGHVVAGYFAKENFQLSKVEITPRGDSLGVTCPDVDEEKFSWFISDWKSQIIFYLGGMAAEKLIYNETSSGVAKDIQMATMAASCMVLEYGMNDAVGPICLREEVYESLELAKTADVEVQKILKDSLQKTISIIREHQKELETLTNALIEKEVVSGKEVEEMFSKIAKNNE